MIQTEQAIRIKKLIEEHDNIAIFHHLNPDGDCMATSFGLAKALRDNYPSKNIKVVADINDYTPHLRYMDKYVEWEETITEPIHDDYLLIIGDVSNGDRVSHLSKFENSYSKKIVYDHHKNDLTIDNVDEYWSQSDYPAAALMTYEMLVAMDLEIKETAALIINHGILTDTGWYRFAPGHKITFDISGKLNGIINPEEQKKLYIAMQEKTIEDIKFQGWILDTFNIAGEKVAYKCITKEDLDKFGYIPDQAARVNLLQGIKGVESWLFFIQYESHVRVEFRSSNVWINKIAIEFGGGGHQNAAGAKLDKMEDHEKVVNRVLEYVLEEGH